MRSAVSDSDVLIHFAKLGQLSLLKQLYETILIPSLIYREVVKEGLREGRDDAQLVKSAMDEKWIIAERDVDEELAATLASKHKIHIGQSYVLTLALQKNVKTALINESKVRKAARSEGLNVAGTLGVILKAYNSQTLSKRNALAILNEIKQREREFRIHPTIVENAIGVITESP